VKVFESPLNENNNAALKFHNVNQVDKEARSATPAVPKRENQKCSDGRGAANDGHIAFIEIVKRGQFRLAFQARPDIAFAA